MNIKSKIRSAYIIVGVFSLFLMPQDSMAQRFAHGGGGGFHGGGGGGFHPAARPVQVAPRGFNGGARNFGNHVIPAPARGGRGFFGGHARGDVAYHHVWGAHPYYYHPYHPYIWGPYWHPFGFYAGFLTANAFMFDWANQRYWYDQGVFYQPSGSGYMAVAPPVGAVVSYLPNGYETVPVGDDTYYYYGGVFYVSQGGSFRVVPAPAGAIVSEIPEGATEQNINGQSYLLYNNTYYEPISMNGQDAYEVVQVQ
jgi:Family of unknown function (DUF6515)